jgi:hypothetical protein
MIRLIIPQRAAGQRIPDPQLKIIPGAVGDRRSKDVIFSQSRGKARARDDKLIARLKNELVRVVVRIPLWTDMHQVDPRKDIPGKEMQAESAAVWILQGVDAFHFGGELHEGQPVVLRHGVHLRKGKGCAEEQREKQNEEDGRPHNDTVVSCSAARKQAAEGQLYTQFRLKNNTKLRAAVEVLLTEGGQSSINTDCQKQQAAVGPHFFIQLAQGDMPMNTKYIAAALLAQLLTAPAMAEETQQAPAAAESPAPEQKAVRGKVLESMSGADYTYLLVEDGKEKIWAAIPVSKIEVGQEVALQPGMVMKDFASTALNKQFDRIVFSSGLLENAAAPAVEGGTGKPVDEATLAALSGGSSRAVVPANEMKVDKAEGENGRTVEQCFAEAEKLNGKPVKVRGKVVKFTPQIMGKNWIHLQDGSGDPTKNTHDLVVTTSETAAKDAVVVIEGVLSKDKDFGAGYKYAAIIEEAKINK